MWLVLKSFNNVKHWESIQKIKNSISLLSNTKQKGKMQKTSKLKQYEPIVLQSAPCHPRGGI